MASQQGYPEALQAEAHAKQEVLARTVRVYLVLVGVVQHANDAGTLWHQTAVVVLDANRQSPPVCRCTVRTHCFALLEPAPTSCRTRAVFGHATEAPQGHPTAMDVFVSVKGLFGAGQRDERLDFAVCLDVSVLALGHVADLVQLGKSVAGDADVLASDVLAEGVAKLVEGPTSDRGRAANVPGVLTPVD